MVYDRLDGTGRKLLGSLTSQEDAVMLQRRLDEMNHRWNHLKSKSIAIRYVESQQIDMVSNRHGVHYNNIK